MRRQLALGYCLLLGSFGAAEACGLHVQVKNKLPVNYPGAVEVGVAVITARQLGILPKFRRERPQNDSEFLRTIDDLEQLRRRIGNNRSAIPSGQSSSGFSMLLVGSGLWSSVELTASDLLARYHITGPLKGMPVVVTHREVLRTLLSGSLSLQRAYELRLLIFSGRHTSIIEHTLKTAFAGPKAHGEAQF
ncbi:MAG: hypothetical protein ACR2PG_03980 [Hyphomicrobiaceae bacterium]